VSDHTPPTITFVGNGGDLGCNPASVPKAVEVTAHDNCSDDSKLKISFPFVDTNEGCKWKRTITVTVTDEAGNPASTDVVFTWRVDTIAPVIAPLTDGNLGCNPASTPDDAYIKSLVNATDNCLDSVLTIDVTHTDSDQGCNHTRTFTIVVTDGCAGNTAHATVAYTWRIDSTAPTITPLDNKDLGCNPVSVPGDDDIKALVQASDNCAGSVLTVKVTHLDLPAGCNVTRTFTIEVTDGCAGNKATATVAYRWRVDTTAPRITQLPDVDLGCKPASIPGDDAIKALVKATDNCADSVLTINVSHVDSAPSCAMTRTFTIVVTDGCAGNTATSSVLYRWKNDTDAPIITKVPAGGDLGCNPSTLPTDDSVKAQVVASDTCTTSPTINVTHLDGGTDCAKTRTFTITATDACGNASDARTVVYNWKKDTTPPVISGVAGNKSIECPATPVFCTPTAVDNCDGNVAPTYSDSRTELCQNSYSIKRTWTAKDSCGNVSKASQTITVTDTTPPVIKCPPDITLACNSDTSPNTTGAATANDSCSGPVTPTYKDTTTLDQDGNTVITRVWTALDGCGNSSKCTQIIKVTKCVTYETYTPGGWGAPARGNNIATKRDKYFGSIYGSYLKIGGNKTIKLNGPDAIEAFLPSGGTPGKLTQNYVDPTGSTTAGEFASQVLALQLNVDFSNAGYIKPGLPNLKVAPGNKLAGYTVMQVLQLANIALGGGALPAGCSYSDLTDLLSKINGNYDGGTSNNGYLVP